jgi:hypothetical protein
VNSLSRRFYRCSHRLPRLTKSRLFDFSIDTLFSRIMTSSNSHSHNNNNVNHNNGNNNNNNSDFSKKEEFRRYLERTGVLDALTKVLVGLYEEPDRPSNSLEYMKRYLGAPVAVDVEGLKRENEELKSKVNLLKKQLYEQTKADNN